MPSRTNLKISEQIRQRAAHVILFELKDPRMGFVTITHVKLGADLTSCTIYWSVLGGPSERSKTAHALEHARLFVQRRVAEGLRLRSAPQLTFEYDESVEGAIKMGETLKKLRTERGETADAPAAAAGEPSAAAGEPPEADEDADSEDDSDAEPQDDSEDSEPATDAGEGDEAEEGDAEDADAEDADDSEDDAESAGDESESEEDAGSDEDSAPPRR